MALIEGVGAALLPLFNTKEGDIFSVQLVYFRVTESLSIDSTEMDIRHIS